MTQSYLNKRLANQGNCDSYTDFRKYNSTNSILFRNILNYIFNIFYSIIRCLISILKGRIEWHKQYAEIFYYLNRIKYDYRLIFDDSWKMLVLKNNWLLE